MLGRTMAVAAALFATSAARGGGPGVTGPLRYFDYDLATQSAVPAGGIAWAPAVAWDNAAPTGVFTTRPTTIKTLDWADITPGTQVVMFQIGYATNSTTPITIDVEFYGSDDGWNSAGRIPLEAFSLTGLPVSTVAGQVQQFAVTIDLRPAGRQFAITGSDLDGDARVDFSYTYRMRNRGNASATGMGPLFGGAGPILPPGAVGREDAFDRFIENPPGSNQFQYDGTFRFSGPQYPLNQYHMRLYGPPKGMGDEDIAEPIDPSRVVEDP